MKHFSLLNVLLPVAALTTSAAGISSSDHNNIVRDEPLIYPYATYRYWVATGQIKEDPQDQLLIVKNGVAADETTTIVTFDFAPELEGRTCKLLFDLWDRDVSTGSQTADVFSVIDPPDSRSGSGSNSDLSATSFETALALAQSRDQHVGRIHVPKPGTAEWVMSYYGWPEFPCPAGQLIGIEYVGVGDNVEIRWDIGVTGPRVQVL